MFSNSRANLIWKIAFSISVIIAIVILCVIGRALLARHASLNQLLLQRSSDEPETRIGHLSVGIKTNHGLMVLIANATRTVVAMETQALQLDAELKRMRETTRELLWQRRKTAMWTTLHKCIFFYGCKGPSLAMGSTPSVSNRTVPLPYTSIEDSEGESVVRDQQRELDRKYAMYRLRPSNYLQ